MRLSSFVIMKKVSEDGKMFKKINLIIISIFTILTLLFGIGFALYIPLIVFFMLRDNRNIYYVSIPSLLAVFLLARPFLTIFIALIIVLFIFQLIVEKISKGLYIYALVILLNITTQVILSKLGLMIGFSENLWYIISLNIISLLLYLYFEQNLIESLVAKEAIRPFFDNSYLEIIIAIIAIMGASHIVVKEINIAFILAIYLAMYFASSFKDIYAMIYALIIMAILVFGFNIKMGLFIPFITAIYFLPFSYPLIVVNVFITAVIFAKTDYPDLSLLSIMGVSIIFEVLKCFLIKQKVLEKVFYEKVHEQVTNQLNNEILAFANFLDRFAEGVKTPNDFNERISDGIKTIVQNHCKNCERKKACYAENKGNIYLYFRDLLVQKDLNNSSFYQFSKTCPHFREIEYTSRSLNKRIDFITPSSNNNALIAQISGISNAIKKYAIEISSKEEMDYEIFSELKKRLVNYGYDITYFEIKRSFIDDYFIFVGIKSSKDDFDSLSQTIKIIGDNLITDKISVIFEKEERNTIYFKIIPEIRVDIIYGYGAVSSEGNQISGDNYLIKDLDNGHFISAISDGMGKGYSAFHESNITLKLVEDVIGLNLDSSTALEILNTFYVIQDYLERYATLDLLEINRHNFIARFYKMGGGTTYILKEDGQIEKIINKSLPFGIEEGLEKIEYPLANNDLVIMSSDGVFDNIIDDDQIEPFLRSVKELSPQKIVYELINYTINAKILTNDDMTIIALRVKEA